MPVQPISFQNEGQTLFGMMHIPEPETEKPFPAVLFLHGFQAQRVEAHRIFVKMARLLEEEGIASFRFDFRGCGESDGKMEEVTIKSQLEDALAAFSFLTSQHHIDHKKIAVLGMSLGGGIAALLASKEERISSLTLWSPVADLMECLTIKMGDKDPAELFEIPVLDDNGNLVGQSFIREIPHFEPAKGLKEFKKPVCLIHGTADQIVPFQQSEEFENHFSGKHPASHCHLIEGADHQYSSAAWQKELFETSLLFLKDVWS